MGYWLYLLSVPFGCKGWLYYRRSVINSVGVKLLTPSGHMCLCVCNSFVPLQRISGSGSAGLIWYSKKTPFSFICFVAYNKGGRWQCFEGMEDFGCFWWKEIGDSLRHRMINCMVLEDSDTDRSIWFHNFKNSWFCMELDLRSSAAAVFVSEIQNMFVIPQTRKARLARTVLLSFLRVVPILCFGFAFLKLLPPWPGAVHPFPKHVYQLGRIRKWPNNSFSSVSFNFHWQRTWQPVVFPEAQSPKLFASRALLYKMVAKSSKDPADRSMPAHHCAHYPSRYGLLDFLSVYLVKPGF